MDIIMKIQNEFLNLSQQEKKIADYILRTGDEIKNMNINELSEKTETSNATITRFAKKMGCKTYVDLKFQINQISIPKIEETSRGIADDVFNYYQRVIKNTQNLIDMKKMDELIKMIKSADEIVIVGVSSSGTTAGIMATRLMRMGLTASSYADISWMKMRAKLAKKNNLFIALSTTGTTRLVIDTLKMAKENNARIASITGFTQNPIADLSDLSLHVYSTRFIDNQKFVNSQFSMMYLIDVITTYILEDKDFMSNMTKSRDSIGDI